MNPILQSWNESSEDAAISSLISCCAAKRWASALTGKRPFPNEASLYETADQVWSTMQEPDWMEAFRAHPRIGERKPAEAPEVSTQSKDWSSQEQSSVTTAQTTLLAELAAGNKQYEDQFGFTYIVCATGKSAEEMLTILQRRLNSDRQTELREAAEQQRQITQIRLRKWLQS